MKKLSIVLFFLVGFIALAHAQVYVANASAQQTYFPGETLSGWANLSFIDQPVTSYFTDSEGNKVLLGEFLNKTGMDYHCSTKDCASSFDGTLLSNPIKLNLKKGTPILLGFKLIGNIKQIDSVTFNITSTAGQSDTNQLKLDLGNDGTIDAGNSNSLNTQSGSLNKGCYDSSGETVQTAELDQGGMPYCQNITLDEAPGLYLVGWIQKIGTGNNSVEMSLYDNQGTFLSKCSINATDISPTGSIDNCQVNQSITQKSSYYLCISKTYGNANFNIHRYVSSNPSKNCGYFSTPQQIQGSSPVASYDIGIFRKKFAPFGTVKIGNTLPNRQTVSGMFESYLSTHYDTTDGYTNCSQGCYIPMKLIPSVDQNVTVSPIDLSYSDTGGTGLHMSSMYSLQESPALVTSTYQKISLDGIFNLSTSTTPRLYWLRMGSKGILSTNITMENTTFSLKPLKTISAYQTPFSLESTPPQQMVGYTWNFGDNSSSVDTVENSTSHEYVYDGNYTVNVLIKTTSGKVINKTFMVEATSPAIYISKQLTALNNRITTLTSQFDKLTKAEQDGLASQVNLTQMQKDYDSIKQQNLKATTPALSQAVVSRLISLDYPDSIDVKKLYAIPYFPTSDKISVNSINSLSPDFKTDSSNQDVVNAALYWAATNTNTTIQEKDISLVKGTAKSIALRTYTLTVTPKTSLPNYYVFYDPSILTLATNDVSHNASGLAYIEIPGKAATVEFTTSQSLSSKQLPLFISPLESNLNLVPTVNQVKQKSHTLEIVLIILGILIAGFVIYFMLAKWYKTKYERHLFKNRNNLYNVMVYVNSSKKSGMSDEEIISKLREAGWTHEQIRYIMRRFEKRETGLPVPFETNTEDAKKRDAPKNPSPQNYIGQPYKP